MEYNKKVSGEYLQPDHQLFILTHLLQTVGELHHIDEIFILLAENMVQCPGVEALQICSGPPSSAGPMAATIRAAFASDASMPAFVLINESHEEVVSRILSEQRNLPIQPVENLFSAFQSRLCKRYGLKYCGGCFLSSHIPVPPASGVENMLPSSTLAVLVFFSELYPQSFLETIHHIMEQALLIARKRGMLLSPLVHEFPIPPSVTPFSYALPPLYELIPHRIQSSDSMRSSNPFTSAASTLGKRELALFRVIDGSRNIAKVAALSKLGERDIARALRVLLEQKRIQVYTSEARVIENEILLKHISAYLYREEVTDKA